MLTMGQKKAVTRELQDRYQKCSKKEKGIGLSTYGRTSCEIRFWSQDQKKEEQMR